jgi:hypothetical protein
MAQLATPSRNGLIVRQNAVPRPDAPSSRSSRAKLERSLYSLTQGHQPVANFKSKINPKLERDARLGSKNPRMTPIARITGKVTMDIPVAPGNKGKCKHTLGLPGQQAFIPISTLAPTKTTNH